MKLFTLIIATVCLVSVSNKGFAGTGDSTFNMLTAAQVSTPVSIASSIKFNPIGIANGVVKVKMYNQLAGVYTVQVLDENGNVLASTKINHDGGTQTQIAAFGKSFTGGTYQVAVIAPDNTKTNETIMLLM